MLSILECLTTDTNTPQACQVQCRTVGVMHILCNKINHLHIDVSLTCLVYYTLT